MTSGLGLGGYSSSDDENDQPMPDVAHATATTVTEERQPVKKHSTEIDTAPSTANVQTPLPAIHDTPVGAAPGPALGPSAASVSGPALGPSYREADGPASALEDGASAPTSPYTASRLLIRDLTMPPVPNFEIPPSPPGSPPPASTAKFDRFLELKRKGTHFNERLQQSSALRNPGLLSSLMDFAGITEEDSRATTLPSELGVPTKFIKWAYADELVKAHEKLAKERARAPGQPTQFVSGGQEGSTGETTMPAREPAPMTAAERVRAGLSRDNSKAPAARGGDDRTESRRSRFDDKDGKHRRRSRSPRRD